LKSPIELDVEVAPAKRTTALVYPADRPRIEAALVLAHGAGAGQHSAFMIEFARGLAASGVDIVTFDFLYVRQKRRLPDRGPILEDTYRAVIEHVIARKQQDGWRTLFIGGKSMGGRIATQVASAHPRLPIDGLVLLGYPLHPPGRPEQRRDRHLPAVRRPMLFVQGRRDAFGTPDELERSLGPVVPAPVIHVVEEGDHSLKVSRNPAVQAKTYASVQRAIVQWMDSVGGRN
jgi:predicted alpha/beta-hydrolase family hydrolase